MTSQPTKPIPSFVCRLLGRVGLAPTPGDQVAQAALDVPGVRARVVTFDAGPSPTCVNRISVCVARLGHDLGVVHPKAISILFFFESLAADAQVGRLLHEELGRKRSTAIATLTLFFGAKLLKPCISRI